MKKEQGGRLDKRPAAGDSVSGDEPCIGVDPPAGITMVRSELLRFVESVRFAVVEVDRE